MCGIGKTMAVAECQTVAGATDATITTEVGSLSSVCLVHGYYVHVDPFEDAPAHFLGAL